jgi:hypothetical protein
MVRKLSKAGQGHFARKARQSSGKLQDNARHARAPKQGRALRQDKAGQGA